MCIYIYIYIYAWMYGRIHRPTFIDEHTYDICIYIYIHILMYKFAIRSISIYAWIYIKAGLVLRVIQI
jgi:hypothetical protein